MPETHPLAFTPTEYLPEHRQYTFHANPDACNHTCDHCKMRSAELSFSFLSPKDDYDESGYCCTVCGMGMVTELSSVERTITVKTSDGLGCEIHTSGDEDE